MKTETQIAEENLKYYNKSFKNGLMSDLGIYQKEDKDWKKICLNKIKYKEAGI